MLQILSIPAFRDNYIWLLHLPEKTDAVIVDPGDAKPVFTILHEKNLTPSAILLTHHHYDHTNGVKDLLNQFDIPVYGPVNDNIMTVTHPVSEREDTIVIQSLMLYLKILDIPGHTQGHIAYYAENHNALFCGDTLFTAGAGRLFEGTAEQLFDALSRLALLPDITRIYCGHEYTLSNLKFAQTVEPDNVEIKTRIAETELLRARNLPTVPSTLLDEKKTNPFLRCHEVSVKNAVQHHFQKQCSSPQAVFKYLRLWKDNFST